MNKDHILSSVTSQFFQPLLNILYFLFRTLDTLVEPMEWLSYILIHRYSAAIFVANEFKDLDFDCDRNGKFEEIGIQ
jgi:hypothetical protein